MVSYLRLKTSVKLHTDQMMRTRNFRVRNEVVERGAVSKSQKGKKAHVERKVGVFFSGRHMDNVPKETHGVPVMADQYKETCTVVRDEKGRSSSPHQIRWPREKHPQKHHSTEVKALQSKGAKFRAVTNIGKTVM